MAEHGARRAYWLVQAVAVTALLCVCCGCTAPTRSQLIACQQYNIDLQNRMEQMARTCYEAQRLARENELLRQKVAEQERTIAALQMQLLQALGTGQPGTTATSTMR